VGRSGREVVWTSGGTEADNLAILGVAARAERRRLVVSAVEHKAVLAPAAALAAAGWTVDWLPVAGDGVAIATPIPPDTALVSLMAANNETGAVQPIAAYAEAAHAAGALFHVDAAQAGYLDLAGVDADLITLSAHKIGGPIGVGALIVKAGTRLAAVLHGGGHERGLRPGTVNVPGVAAFAAAAAELLATRAVEAARLAALRDRLADRILAEVPQARRIGRPEASAPQILCLVFPGVEGEALVTQLDLAGLAASSGAACTTLGQEPSHVLPALGLDAAAVAGSLRLSLGWSTTAAEIDEAAKTVVLTARMLLEQRPMRL
ncbi:MAG: cysteine desulfurase, partial [Cyanobacteria bacterium RYN_339]|nr:cysteine desulfurase [Cyanobacteria bacterium RYN_339]